MDDKSRNYGLDIARCLAILLVFGIHALQNIFSPDIPYIWYLAYAGVELFFALSGFLIGKILFDIFLVNNGRLSFNDLKNFIVRRWLRTLPLYYFVLLTLLILYSLKGEEVLFQWRYFFFLNNFISKPPSFFGESWSLAIEEWFYILFSSGLFIGTIIFFFNTKKALTKIGAANLFAVLLIIFIIAIWILKLSAIKQREPGDIFTIVIYRLDAIAYGILAYWIFYTWEINKNGLLMLFLLSFLLIFAAVVLRFIYPEPKISGLSYYFFAGLGYAGLVLALSLYPWKNKYSAVTHISKISYSIYVTHLSLILFPLIKFCHPATVIQKTVFLFVYVMLTYLISICTYTFIESPFNKIRNHYFTNKAKVPAKLSKI